MATKNENGTPWMATHPGTVLKYELEDRDLSQKEFAVLMGMQKSHVSELLRGKRPLSKPLALKIEEKLGISAVTLLNLQTQFDYDSKTIVQRGLEEQAAKRVLDGFNELIDVTTLLKRLAHGADSMVQKLVFLRSACGLQRTEDLKLVVDGMFRKSAKTGLDVRMLLTWKIMAEYTARRQQVEGVFVPDCEAVLVPALMRVLHENCDTVASVKRLLSNFGIAFCVVEKVDRASVDGYSFLENGVPYIVLTKRFDRIDNFAFALMHEVGHVFRHCLLGQDRRCKLSIPDYDNDSPEEREANVFAANALIPYDVWKKAPLVRLTPVAIQRKYTQWAEDRGLNKWIVLGRIAFETGMYKFVSDDSRRIG